MKNRKQLSRRQKFRHKFGFTSLCIVLGFLFVLGFKLLLGMPAFTQTPQQVKVTVLLNALEASQWNTLLMKDFKAQNPDIQLEIIEGPNASNLIEDLYTSAFLLGDSPYDLVYMDIVWVQKFAAAGWLRDLSDRISDKELTNFIAGDVNGGRYEGGLYRMPFRSDAGMLYYRTDLLKQGGYKPPETFNELLEIGKALKKPGENRWGYLWQGRQYEGLAAMFVEVLEGAGGFWVNPENGNVGLDQPAAVEAVKFLQNTIKTGVSPGGVTTYGEEETRQLFQSGNGVFLRNWPYVWSLAEDSAIAGKYNIKPMVHAPGKNSGACQGGWGMGIAKTSKHPDEAWRVIQFFNRPEIQRKFILGTGYVPSRRSLFTDPQIVAKYSHYPQLLKVTEKSVLRPPIAQYSQASDILQRYLSAALTNRMTPERAMKAAANETRRLLSAQS
ncbi:ABC transporter substrate-binding protein [Microcoleus sp. FACHB-672]|uniref:ABC transporter substrate-binding protein n=1 Tax=Microcoleus sp. FACHB-672 TaxID=2692825 RepID=UPI00168617C6|nr:extracellular solute-binding protein [Microcoleus sp. FACHB-672]